MPRKEILDRIQKYSRDAERRADMVGAQIIYDKRVRLVVLPYRNGEYLYLLFVAPEGDFAGLQATFNRMMNSLQLR